MQSTFETTDIFRGAFFLSKGGKLSNVHLFEYSRRIVSFHIVGNNLSALDEALLRPTNTRPLLGV